MKQRVPTLEVLAVGNGTGSNSSTIIATNGGASARARRRIDASSLESDTLEVRPPSSLAHSLRIRNLVLLLLFHEQ